MTEMLKPAITKLKTFPSESQDAIAARILEEFEDEQHWDQAFSGSPDVLVSKSMACFYQLFSERILNH